MIQSFQIANNIIETKIRGTELLHTRINISRNYLRSIILDTELNGEITIYV